MVLWVPHQSGWELGSGGNKLDLKWSWNRTGRKVMVFGMGNTIYVTTLTDTGRTIITESGFRCQQWRKVWGLRNSRRERRVSYNNCHLCILSRIRGKCLFSRLYETNQLIIFDKDEKLKWQIQAYYEHLWNEIEYGKGKPNIKNEEVWDFDGDKTVV